MSLTDSEYVRLLPTLETVLAGGVRDLTEFLRDEGVPLACPVDGRIKSWTSLQDKAVRKQLDITRVTEVLDVVGLRVVVLFESDVDRAGIAVERLFKFHERQHTQSRLVEDQFGYASLHYSMSADWAWLQKLGLPASLKIPIEVQVRTMAQHVWAAASHHLQYKSEVSVPPELRRAVSRLAALAELIDLELSRIAQERESYRKYFEVSSSSETSLNVEAVKEILSAVWPEEHRSPDEPYHAVLGSLPQYAITTRQQFLAVLIKNREAVLGMAQRKASRLMRDLQKEKREGNQLIVERPSHTTHVQLSDSVVERAARGIFFSHTGLTFTALALEEDSEPDRKRL